MPAIYANFDFMLAARQGDCVKLREYLEKKTYSVDTTEFCNVTALQHTAQMGHMDATRLLLSFGADTKAASPNGLSSGAHTAKDKAMTAVKYVGEEFKPRWEAIVQLLDMWDKTTDKDARTALLGDVHRVGRAADDEDEVLVEEDDDDTPQFSRGPVN